MQTRSLGPFTVSAIGLGAMPVSMNIEEQYPSREDAIATVHAALDAGVTLIDTADIYAPSWDQMGHNERIVRDALNSWAGDTAKVLVTTKGGITRGEGETWGRDGSLAYLRAAAQKSLVNLGVEVIDLYQYHRPDRWMVYGEIMENLKTLQTEGLIRCIGISNASIEEIEIARQVPTPGASTSCATANSTASRSSPGVRSAAQAGGAAPSANGSASSARSATRTPRARSRSFSRGSSRSVP